jgi:hypothetical protein
MAVTAKMYGNAPSKMANKEIDFDTDTVKVMLCTSTYTPDQDAHVYKSSVTNEVTGPGYTAGGIALTSKTNTYTGATNTTMLDAADVTWSTSTITARYAVVYVDTGTAGTSALICYVDFGADVASSGGNFTITWDVNGICTFTVA